MNSSIQISPIQTSSSLSPNQLSFSSFSSTNNNGNHEDRYFHEKTPLQQQRSPRRGRNVNRDDPSMMQHGRRRCHQNSNQSFSIYDESCDTRDNRENIYDNTQFSISTSFRSMQVMDTSTSMSSSDHHHNHHEDQSQENECRRVFVDEIDAPSDEQEEDDRVYEMNLVNNNSSASVHTPTNIVQRRSDNDDCTHNGEEEEESEEQKLRREQEESEALARQLMAEEAMASYAQSTNFLRSHANEYSEEDLRALEALMAEEDPMNEEVMEEEAEEESEELSYDALLRLGERIGDVKTERWAMRAQQEIEKLQTVTFCKEMARGKDENDCAVKCLVCQFQYEEGEKLRVLPCGHSFHNECVDQWLLTKDHCPYCRQSITKA